MEKVADAAGYSKGAATRTFGTKTSSAPGSRRDTGGARDELRTELAERLGGIIEMLSNGVESADDLDLEMPSRSESASASCGLSTRPFL